MTHQQNCNPHSKRHCVWMVFIKSTNEGTKHQASGHIIEYQEGDKPPTLPTTGHSRASHPHLVETYSMGQSTHCEGVIDYRSSGWCRINKFQLTAQFESILRPVPAAQTLLFEYKNYVTLLVTVNQVYFEPHRTLVMIIDRNICNSFEPKGRKVLPPFVPARKNYWK